MSVRLETVRPDEGGMRLDRWFKTRVPEMPFGRLQQALRKGEIRVDGGRAKANSRVESGQQVRIPPFQASETPTAAEKSRSGGRMKTRPGDAAFAQSLVIHRNRDILAVNKPAGLAVQGGQGTERHLDGLLDHLTYDADERPRLVHRLDRDTSGVMVLARSRAASTTLARAFKDRAARKIYWAITVGVPRPASGTIDLPLSKGGPAGRERVHVDQDGGKSAITDFAVLDHAGKRAALVALWPRTGRTHQIRAHLAALETPILGDGKYGGRTAFLDGEGEIKGVQLHARELVIPRGVAGAGTRLLAPPPDTFKQALRLFGLSPSEAATDPFEAIS